MFDFRLIGIGLIFLLDFNIDTIDVLPDIVGLAFISAGLGKAFYASERLSKAKKYINIFCGFAIVKLAWNVAYFVFGIREPDSSFALLFACIFSSFELFLGIFSFSNIFGGLNEFFLTGGKISDSKNSDFTLRVIKIIFVCKFALSIAAQLPILFTDNFWDGLSVAFGYYLNAELVKNMLVAPCFLIQALAGLFLLSLALPFFFGRAKDDELYDFIKSKINDAISNNRFFAIKQNLQAAFLLFMAGCLFFVDFVADGINFLPDFAICAFFVLGLYILQKNSPEANTKKLKIYLVANFFVSLLAYIFGLLYRLQAEVSFVGEHLAYLRALGLSYAISFEVSVVLFFMIFIEFYSFLIDLRRKHLEFSERYLNKYFSASEKNFDKNKARNLRIFSVAFCAKALETILPSSGIVFFLHSAVLAAFALFMVKGLYESRDAIYSYYKSKDC
ncbi:MAG: hypothetical protein FWH48_02345 [Oscillospiraceae bacterium]|nr:hypothetical protein [Oscillospiraceae bacterium]